MKLIVRFIAVVCFLWPCPADSFAENVKVGLIVGESSISVSKIPVDLLGARLAVEDLNREGGLLGNRVELMQLDNGSTPLAAKFAAEKAADAGVIAVIGPARTSHALLAGAVLQKSRIPMISSSATNPNVTLLGDCIFRVCFTDRLQGQALADFAAHELKAKTAVVLTCTGEKYSIELAEIFMDRFQNNGGTTLWEGEYLNASTDFRELLKKLAQHRPGVVFLPGYDRASGFIIKQSRDMGIDATFLGGDAWSNILYKFGGEAIEGSYYAGHWDVQSEDKISRDFVDRYKDRYPTGEILHFGMSHDAVFLLADAVRRAHSLDPALIRQALAATVNFHGVTGTIRMDENGDPVKPVPLFRFEAGTSVSVKVIQP